jgi:AsmA protein
MMNATNQSAETAQEAAAHRRRRRRLLGAAFVIVVLLLLALTPPLLNVGGFRRRIVASMSQSLGRPVHLDRVTLHLLPMPGFTLENLVVSEDPAFGDEPIIRANTVEATLRVRSLWKRRVEFSTVSFTDPSVNLVRNADGRWNLENVLVHASRVDTAPTAQEKAGPAPRFPYIEATGGRINIKVGEEKMPFSLTDADFALWLPSPQTWRVRLVGKPARTDTHIGDPGVFRLEGTLERAAHMAEVPVDLQMSWHDAPLGEASLLTSGEDRGWRGTLHADAALKGPLGAAALKTQITLDDLRRADFVPAQSLDVSVSCASTANVPAATLEELACTVPASGAAVVLVESPAVDLAKPLEAETLLQAQKLPLEWVFGWVRLFSARVPAQPVQGVADVSVMHAASDPQGPWSGTVGVTVPVAARGANGKLLPAAKSGSAKTVSAGNASAGNASAGSAVSTAQSFEAALATTGGGGWGLNLPQTPLRLGPGAELTMSAQASAAGYGFTVTGQASPAQLNNITHALPQLADGSGELLPKTVAADVIRPVAVTCSRAWTSGQMCVAAPVTVRKTNRAARTRR